MADDQWTGTGDDQFISTADDSFSGPVTKSLVSITVTPASVSAYVGHTQQFTATGYYNDSSTADITSSVTWASSQTGYATIASGGLVTCVAAGVSSISATFGSISGNTNLTVVAVTLTSITVTPAGASIYTGVTQQYAATGYYNDGSTGNLTSSVTWTSSVTGRATITSPGGLATGTGAGATTITATLGGVSGNTSLTVIAVILTSITVLPVSSTVIIGGTQQFTATGHYNNGATQDLTNICTWTSFDTYYATITNPGGLATGVRSGSAVVTAAYGGFSGTSTLTIQVSLTLTSVTVTPASQSIYVGHTLQYTATGTYSNGSTSDITATVSWASSDPTKATISSGGLATGVLNGSTTISATLSGVSGSTGLTVAVTLTSIVVTPAAQTIARGASQQCTATGHYSDSSTANITSLVSWLTSNMSLAFIDSGGLITALGFSSETANVWASYQGVTGTTTITVTVPPVTKGRFLYSNLITSESMLAASSVKTGRVTSAVKIGTGSVAIVTAGSYSGTSDLEYVVEIDSAGTGEIGSSTFKWSSTGGASWNATGVATDHTAITLNNGVTVCWPNHGAGADFVLGDKWYFKGVNTFSLSKMLDLNRDTRYRSESLGSPNTITISLGSALEAQALIIGDHNLTSGAVITLHFDTSTSFSGGNYHYEIIPWASGKILYYLTHVVGERTRRYWRINITDASNPNGYIEIGELYLGSYTELSKNYQEGFSKETSLIIKNNPTSYGVGRDRFYNTQLLFSFDYEFTPTVDITTMQTMIDSLGSRSTGVFKPIWINLDSAYPNNCWLVKPKGLPVKHNTSVYFDTTLEFEEVLRSI
jgi:uncharacterized protein YjdB